MLYIHIPFCKSKCIYCDFYSGGNPQWQKYIKAVVLELSLRINELKDDSLSSIYIGGGTPSLIPEEDYLIFLDGIYSCLESNGISITPVTEITLEVNPEDVTKNKIEAWKSKGVNRISMGVQSLNDGELKIIKRRHNAQKALRSLEQIKKAFDNFSVDLMYGLPGQTLSSLEASLKSLLQFHPPHISIYSLTFEEGTPLTILRDRKEISEAGEDEFIDYNNIIQKQLADNGYERYEISNYSLPGFRSRHNSGYWTGKPYLGLGPSASSFDGDKIRRNNPADLKKYLEYFENPYNESKKFYIEEQLSQEEQIEECIFLSLRTSDGLSLNTFASKFGDKLKHQILQVTRNWINSGHLKLEEERLILTPKGFDISDYIILDLIGKME